MYLSYDHFMCIKVNTVDLSVYRSPLLGPGGQLRSSASLCKMSKQKCDLRAGVNVCSFAVGRLLRPTQDVKLWLWSVCLFPKWTLKTCLNKQARIWLTEYHKKQYHKKKKNGHIKIFQQQKPSVVHLVLTRSAKKKTTATEYKAIIRAGRIKA